MTTIIGNTISIGARSKCLGCVNRLGLLDDDVVAVIKADGYDDEVNKLLAYAGKQIGELPAVIDKFETTEIDNPEWRFVMVDSDDHILLGIKVDGYLYGVKDNELKKL